MPEDVNVCICLPPEVVIVPPKDELEPFPPTPLLTPGPPAPHVYEIFNDQYIRFSNDLTLPQKFKYVDES